MSKKSIATPEFLLPEQLDMLQGLQAVDTKIDSIIAGREHPIHFVPAFYSLASETTLVRDLQNQITSTKATVDDPEDAEDLLRVGATHFRARDLYFSCLTKAVAIQTAMSQSEGHDMDVFRGYELGTEIMRMRALQATNNLMSGAGMLLMHEGVRLNGGDFESLWEHAKRAYYVRRGVKEPVQILQPEGEALDDLLRKKTAHDNEHAADKPTLPFKIGRSKKLNLLRAAAHGVKHTIRGLREGHTTMEVIQSMYEQSFASSTVFEMSDEQMAEANGTIDKMARYIRRAGLLDSCISKDPRTKYFGYLVAHAEGTNLDASRSRFAGHVNTIAKRNPSQGLGAADLQLE